MPDDTLTRVHGRFARSVRLGSDRRADALDGYLPTTRSLEVVTRVVTAMCGDGEGRALSITGPYGSGKSSLAVFLDSLSSRTGSAPYRQALQLLRDHAPDVADALPDARRSMGATKDGFARAVVTAPQREPITTTVLRALLVATEGLPARARNKLMPAMQSAVAQAEDPALMSPSYSDVKTLLADLASHRPVLLVIDEFGKNLEAFADAAVDSDMYLLQELAEWAGTGEIPLLLVTIQHLAFEAYAGQASTAKRREWAKVQGRFSDIPFVDSAASTRRLIATGLEHAEDPAYTAHRMSLAERAATAADKIALSSVSDPDTIAACFPLHPTTLLVLPELCTRYGQNERTLFSFLASGEPLSVTSFLNDAGRNPDWVRIERVYDYFVESASTFIGASPDVSRWVEVETTVRDAHGLDEAQRRVLKTVGVLNLVASAGTVRASRDLVAFACADGYPGTETEKQIAARLVELEDLGLLTYRDFASEYRIWRGSDIDLNTLLTTARRIAADERLAETLHQVMPQTPMVAARHTAQRGTVRAFAREFGDHRTKDIDGLLPPIDSVRDGLLLYLLETDVEPDASGTAIPVITVTPKDPETVLEAAIEVAALEAVAADPHVPADDQAIRREIIERSAHARQVLSTAVTDAFGPTATWRWVNAPEGPRRLPPAFGSKNLSDVLDEVFPVTHSPRVGYEVINRSELTSAGARARGDLFSAMMPSSNDRLHNLGIEGAGADVAMYREVFARAGMHTTSRGWSVPDDDPWVPSWNMMHDVLSSDDAIRVDTLFRLLGEPPYGFRNGVASLLLAGFVKVNRENIALYEHGTFIPQAKVEHLERLVRNPRNFGVKLMTDDAASDARTITGTYLGTLASGLGEVVDRDAPEARVLPLVRTLVSPLRNATKYLLKTRRPFGINEAEAEPAIAVRDALVTATEPDTLLFDELPQSVGFGRVQRTTGRSPTGYCNKHQAEEAAAAICAAVKTLVRIEDALHEAIAEALFEPYKNADFTVCRKAMIGDAVSLKTSDTLHGNMSGFRTRVAITEEPDEPAAWAAAVANGVDGVPTPAHWADPDVAAYLKSINEAAHDFRRVAMVHRLADAREDQAEGFVAFSARIGTSDGADIGLSPVVSVSDTEVDALGDDLNELVDKAQAVLGLDDTDSHEATVAAAETLVALLASRVAESRKYANNANRFLRTTPHSHTTPQESSNG